MSGLVRVRDLFSIVAVLLVAVLCAALAVPYFVDWQSRRAEVEAALGQAFGVEVHTQGAITVRLLPTPRLALERISVGGEKPVLTAEGLDVALEAPPLISGRIEVNSARLVRPTLRIAVDGDGAVRLPAPVRAPIRGIEAAGIARLDIEQGTIRVAGASGERVIGPIDASASAPSLAGPWRIEGGQGRYTFNAGTGAPDAAGRLRLKLRASDTAMGAQADFDGHVEPGERPGIAGKVSLSLPLPRAINEEEEKRVTATADVTSAGLALTASNVEIRSGEGTGAVLLNGTGSVDLGALRHGSLPRAVFDLNGRRLDIRPLATALAGEGATGAAAAGRLLGGLPLDLSLAVGSLAYATEEFGAASMRLLTDPAPQGFTASLPRAELALPGGGRITITDGAIDAGPRVAGTVAFAAGEAGRLANALKDAAVNATSIDELGLILRLSNTVRDWPGLAVRGRFEATPAGIAVRDLDASAGDRAVSGDLNYIHATEGERARADARLVLQGLDLEALPHLDPMRIAGSGVDLDVALEARRLRLGAAAPSDGRTIAAHFSTAADGITISRFELSDPGGARVSASGHLGDEGGRIAAAMEAQNPAALLALYRSLLPASLGDALARAAPALGPLKLDASVARPGAGSPLVAVVKGSAARTLIDGQIVSDPTGDAGDRAVIDLRLTSPDAASLLRQLGLGDGRVAASNPAAGEFTLSARGNAFTALKGRASLSTASGSAALDGQWRGDRDGSSLSGPVQLETADAGALAALLGWPLPATGEPVAVSLAGALQWRPGALAVEELKGTVAGNPVAGRLSTAEGGLRGEIALDRLALPDLLALALGPGARPQAGQVWSSRRLGGAPALPQGTLTLNVKRLAVAPALALADAPLRIDIAPETLTLAIADAGFDGGGRARGEIVLRRLGAQVNLRGNVAVEGMALSALTRQPVAGDASGKLEFGASAESVAGLVANLAGGGEWRITASSVPGLDPGAMARTLAALTGGATIEVDPKQVATRLAGELDKGVWPVEDLTVPLTMASGTVRFGPLALESAQARAGVNGSIDLATLALDARANLVPTRMPDGWSGALPQAVVVWRGPFDAPVRQVEAGSIANGLAAIGLTRELDRIERLEAEARERIEKARREREERVRQEAERARLAAEQERIEREARKREAEAREAGRRQELEREAQAREAEAREAAKTPPAPESPPPARHRPEPPLHREQPAPAAPLDIRPGAQGP